VKTLDIIKPQFFVMENVPAIITREDGRLRDQIIEDFRRVGYETEWEILNAVDFGVPQFRKRAVFIGNRVEVPNPFPKPSHIDPQRGQVTLELDKLPMRYQTVFDAISDLPSLKPGGGADEVPYPQSVSLTEYQVFARQGSTKLYNHVARNHSDRDQQAFAMLEPGDNMMDLPADAVPYRRNIFPDKIKKQRWDRPSSAIVAHMQKDGLMFVHPDKAQARTFTPREAARLQSFPDRYRFIGPMTQQFKQIGNAVPPILGKSIACAIKPWLEPVTDPRVVYETPPNAALLVN
jgi:DNA (cytosine-5)-methyltransferase 1